ncbi:hypothetical protein Plhal304r1_c062g0149721 [Plasmopara halstedii]
MNLWLLIVTIVKANSRCRRLTQKQKLSHFAHQKHHLPAPISSRTLKSVIFNWVNQLAGCTFGSGRCINLLYWLIHL